MKPRKYPTDEDPGLCSNCNGSGEGCADGTTCRVCHGSGEARPYGAMTAAEEREERSIRDADARRECGDE